MEERCYCQIAFRSLENFDLKSRGSWVNTTHSQTHTRNSETQIASETGYQEVLISLPLSPCWPWNWLELDKSALSNHLARYVFSPHGPSVAMNYIMMMCGDPFNCIFGVIIMVLSITLLHPHQQGAFKRPNWAVIYSKQNCEGKNLVSILIAVEKMGTICFFFFSFSDACSPPEVLIPTQKLQNVWPRQDLNLHLLIDQGGNRTRTSGPRDDQRPP